MQTFQGISLEKQRKNLSKPQYLPAAFVSSNVAEECAREIEKDGVPTLEKHKNKDIELQTKDLFKEDMDAVLISNCFPSDLKPKKISRVNRYILELKARLNLNITYIER
ncbi:MupG family TIM beta-alpha barrel fold protein [Borrelia nietonii]|uniref:MupG family TIM beta-alpha barrel fold protein n=1 Tax=Borrelia nietonii TaxID=3117462 RepID=UPI0038B24420